MWDADVHWLGTAILTSYIPENTVDHAALLATFNAPFEIGTGSGKGINRDLQMMEQNQASVFEHANAKAGGCTMGCDTISRDSYAPVVVGVHFSYDDNDDVVGVSISLKYNSGVWLLTPSPDSAPRVLTRTFMPGGASPLPQASDVHINSQALQGLGDNQLEALAQWGMANPNSAIGRAIAKAALEEQKRRAEQKQKQKRGDKTDSDKPTTN